MLQRLRILVLAVMGGLVLIGVAIAFPLSAEDGLDAPPVLAFLVPVVVGALLHGVVESVGYRTAAIEPGTSYDEARVLSGQRFTQTMVLRLALCEAVGITGVAAAFAIAPGGFWVYVVAALVSLGLLAFHALPRERSIARVQRALEAKGCESSLREALGGPAGGGVVTEL